MNGMWEMFYKDSEIQNQTREFLKIRMQEKIKVERLLKGEFSRNVSVGAYEMLKRHLCRFYSRVWRWMSTSNAR